jgi:hypothetical protein
MMLVIVMILSSCFFQVARSWGEAVTVRNVAGKVADPGWLKRKVLKNAFVLTVCATNTLRMAKEADEFDSRDLLGADSHHAIDIALVSGYIISGWLLYAVIDRNDWTWKDKTELISSTLFLSREFGEFTYQGMRHGDPFNNNPDWHRNELPGFSAKPTFPYLRDDMISTGRIGTPVVHISCTGIGSYLLGRVR